MKTLEEAIKLFGGEADPSKPIEPQIADMEKDIQNNLSRYSELIMEAQKCPALWKMAECVIVSGMENKMSFLEILIIGMSHTIAVGIEMERTEHGIAA